MQSAPEAKTHDDAQPQDATFDAGIEASQPRARTFDVARLGDDGTRVKKRKLHQKAHSSKTSPEAFDKMWWATAVHPLQPGRRQAGPSSDDKASA
ncbi:MAG: hypothetical protein ACLTQI_03625 [Slackia sp.]